MPANLDPPCWLNGSTSRGRFIAVANGLLNVDRLLDGDGDALQAHSPHWFSSVCAPYDYQPDAQCPRFLAFVHEILEDDADRIALLQEWIGYLLFGDTSLQKFLVLVGDGANGKTVLIIVLTALLGEANVSTVPLELFGQRFQLTPTLGKLANLVPEIGHIDRIAEGFLKAFVAGDRMHFDRKGLPGIDARPTARLVLATNTLPQFADPTGALFRRLIILPFRVNIPPERQDPNLATKLLSELPGIFNWGADGWLRLSRTERFTEPMLSHQQLDEHRVECNPGVAFLLEDVRSARGSTVACTVLYAHYRDWCEARGHKPVHETQFGKQVFRLFPRVKRRKTKGGRHSRRPYEYVGLAMLST